MRFQTSDVIDVPDEGFPSDWPGWTANGGNVLCIYPNGKNDHSVDFLLELCARDDRARTSLLSTEHETEPEVTTSSL